MSNGYIVWMRISDSDEKWACENCSIATKQIFGVNGSIGFVEHLCGQCSKDCACREDCWYEHKTLSNADLPIRIILVDYVYAMSLAKTYPEYSPAVTTSKL